MRVRAASASIVAAAVPFPVTGNAVVSAQRLASTGGAFFIIRASAADSRGTSAGSSCTANWNAHTVGAIQASAAVTASTAGSTLVPATVQCPVAGDTVVVAVDRSASLTARGCRGALPAKPNRSSGARVSRRLARSADAIRAALVATAVGVLRTPASITMTAIADSVGIYAVFFAVCCSCCLAALPTVRTLRANREPACFVVCAHSLYAIEASAAIGAEADAGACATFVAAAVQWAIVFVAIITADRCATALRTLIRRCALCTQCQATRRRCSARRAAARPVDAKNTRAALDIRGAGAPGVSAAIPGAVARDPIAGAHHRAAGLAALARRRTFRAKGTAA